jgi:EAL domain-containing protein (putative c-di-GMP-specific phosphodiesterase class I)
VGRRRDDTAILTAVSGLASDLHLELSADGIDEEFQSTYLEGLGFSTGSGRLFGEAALRSEMFDDHGRLRSSTRSLAPGLAR